MSMKLIITEGQLERLQKHIQETTMYSSVIKQMKEEMDANYEPVEKYVREGGEYFEKPMVLVKADNEIITPKSLYEYMKYKYKTGDEFTKQIIRDWMFGNIGDNYSLSKNVPMN